MGIEEDAVGFLIAAVVIVAAVYLIGGLVLLQKASKACKCYFIGSAVAFVAAFACLYGIFFHQAGGVAAPDMTNGIGLSILAWAIGVAFVLKLIGELSKAAGKRD